MSGLRAILAFCALTFLAAGCCESSSSDEHFYQPRYSTIRSDARHVCIEDGIMYVVWRTDDAYWAALRRWHKWATQYADDATSLERRYGGVAPSLDSMKDAIC